MMLAEQANAAGYLKVRDHTGTSLAEINLHLDGTITIDRGGGMDSVQPYEQDKWVELTLVFNTDHNQFDLYIDGELKRSAVPFRNSGNTVGQFVIGTFSGSTGVFAYDDFQVYAAQGDQPAHLQEVVLSPEAQHLQPGESTELALRGTMSNGQPADLTDAEVVFASNEPELTEFDVQQGQLKLTDQVLDVRSFEVWAEVTLNGITVTSASSDFTVEINLSVIREVLDYFKEREDVQTALYQQLSNRLDQAEHHKAQGRNKQVLKHLEDFQKHLHNQAMQKFISADAKDLLDADAKALLTEWG